MATALNLKRKNIDLPIETFQKLSLMAIAQGKSLKAYIEGLLIAKADSISVEVTDNHPSPTGDSWYSDSENVSLVEEGIVQYKNGKVKACTMDEIKDILGV